MRVFLSSSLGRLAPRNAVLRFAGRRTGRTYRIVVGLYDLDGVPQSRSRQRPGAWTLRGGAPVTVHHSGRTRTGSGTLVEDPGESRRPFSESSTAVSRRGWLRRAHRVGAPPDRAGHPRHRADDGSDRAGRAYALTFAAPAGASGARRTGASSRRCCWRSGVIRTTFQARPRRFIARITSRREVDLPPAQALNAPRAGRRGGCGARPRRARGGRARRRWSTCRRSSKRRRPKKWQTELMVQVMWCTKKTRTRPPQSSASSAAGERAGEREAERERDRQAQARPTSRKWRLMKRMPAVLEQVGRVLAWRRRCRASSNSQPTWACQRPLQRRCRGRRAGCAGRPPRRCGRGACGGRRPRRSPGPGRPSSRGWRTGTSAGGRSRRRGG